LLGYSTDPAAFFFKMDTENWEDSAVDVFKGWEMPAPLASTIS
jgi:hypothetical protein